MERLQQTQEILRELIAFPTVSADSNLELIAFIAGLLEDVGARVELHASPCGTKANLFATLGPERDGGILLSGHTDVVPAEALDWASDPYEMQEREGRLFGRGSCDMKGFIAAALAMAPVFAARPLARPLHFAFTYDEEVGCFGAQHLAEILQEHGPRPAIGIIGEPTEMRIIEGHKGCYEYTTHFTGLSGHGSLPDHGVSAVEYATRYVHHLMGLRVQLRATAPTDCRFDPPYTSVNIGTIIGGAARNVVAPYAHVEWEMRPVQPGDADFVKDNLQRYCSEELLPPMRAVHPGASIELEVVGEVAGLTPTESNEARRIVAELTGANSAELVSFGTEGGIFQELGMDVVVCGPGSIEQAHKADEYVSLDQLEQCLTMLERLAERLGE